MLCDKVISMLFCHTFEMTKWRFSYVCQAMKSSRILSLFLGYCLIHFAYGVYQACEASDDTMMCGDTCLKQWKTCHCGTSNFTVKSWCTTVCCAPEGGCTKDANGDGHCKNGTIQEERTVCNGLCPVALAGFVSLPCKKIQQPDRIVCSGRISPTQVCRGNPPTACPNGTYLDEEYCMSQHTCHYKQKYIICKYLLALESMWMEQWAW